MRSREARFMFPPRNRLGQWWWRKRHRRIVRKSVARLPKCDHANRRANLDVTARYRERGRDWRSETCDDCGMGLLIVNRESLR